MFPDFLSSQGFPEIYTPQIKNRCCIDGFIERGLHGVRVEQKQSLDLFDFYNAIGVPSLPVEDNSAVLHGASVRMSDVASISMTGEDS